MNNRDLIDSLILKDIPLADSFTLYIHENYPIDTSLQKGHIINVRNKKEDIPKNYIIIEPEISKRFIQKKVMMFQYNS